MPQRFASTGEIKIRLLLFMLLSPLFLITYAYLTNSYPRLSFRLGSFSNQPPTQMLGRVARTSLRHGTRMVHTTGSQSSGAYLLRHKFAAAVGVSVIAGSYLGWRINLENKTIALDSDSTRTPDSPFTFLQSLMMMLPESYTKTDDSRHFCRVLGNTVDVISRHPRARNKSSG